jgi:FMN phosphatase YigB (HAD superfamily)
MRYFSVVADSGRVGITKPDPRLFQHALNGLGLANKPGVPTARLATLSELDTVLET